MKMFRRIIALALVMCIGCTAAMAEYEVLQVGSKGDAVVALQEHLILFGYLTGAADGAYGKGTAAGVKAFQKDAGLEQTGVADAATQEALFAKELPEIGFRGAKFGATAAETVAVLGDINVTQAAELYPGSSWEDYSTAGICKGIETLGNFLYDGEQPHNESVIAHSDVRPESVAGYPVWAGWAAFVNPVKDGALAETKDDYLFYAGKYMLGIEGDDAEAWEDLTAKLSDLYGPYVQGKNQRIWKGADDVEVVLLKQEYLSGAFGLAYIWHGADAIIEESYAFLDSMTLEAPDISENYDGL